AAALAVVASATAQADVPYLGAFQAGAAFGGLIMPVTGFDIYSNGATAFFCVHGSAGPAASCGAGGAAPNAPGTQINPYDTATPLNVGDVIHTIYQGVANVVNPGTPSPTLTYP